MEDIKKTIELGHSVLSEMKQKYKEGMAGDQATIEQIRTFLVDLIDDGPTQTVLAMMAATLDYMQVLVEIEEKKLRKMHEK